MQLLFAADRDDSMNKHRILFLHLGHAFGGIEVYMANLAMLLREDADIVALCSHPHLIKRLEAQGVQVIRFPQLRGPLRGLRFLLAAVMLPWLLFRHNIHTVHINGHWESMLLLPCRLLGRRAVSTRHQTWDIPLEHWWHAPKRTLSALVYNTNARFASKVICVSEAVATEVRRHVRPDKIAVIPNWIAAQPEFVDRAPVQGKAKLLFIGRLVIFKGLQLVLEALRGVPGVALTVVGEGPLLEQFRASAVGLDVRFAGFHQDVAPFYHDADIFIMPSIGLEGLPLVSLEAMGNGLACLFSDLPVHREITGDGQAAALFRTGDADDLRRKLLQLIDNPAQCRRLAQSGHAMVHARYTAAVARRSYAEIFQLTQSKEIRHADRADLSQRTAAAE
jgi:glycosyltransferase involved in cell wall biosynthesis